MRRRLARWGFGTGLAVVAGAPTVFVALQPVQVLPRLGLAPGYAFVDQAGARLASDDLRGSIVVYAFDYGACGERCEPTRRTLRELASMLPDSVPGEVPVRLVLVSLDPEEEGGDALAARAEALGADGETWRLATADTAQLRTVVGGGFETWWVREDDGSVSFAPTVVLVDPLGVRRARFRDVIPSADTLLGHVRALATEARATGAAHLAFEAAHLFSCYRTY